MKPISAHFVYPYLFRTGSWLYYLISNQVRYESHIFTGISENLSIFPHPRVHDLNALNAPQRKCQQGVRRLSGTYPRHWALVHKLRPAVVHSHFGNAALNQHLLSKFFAIPHVVSFYGADATKIPRGNPSIVRNYQKMFRNASAVVAEGPYMAKTLEALGCESEKLHVLHLGVPVKDIVFQARAANGRAKILIAASWTEKKGILDALAALNRIDPLTFELTVIGAVPNDNELTKEYGRRVENELSQAKYPVRKLGYVTPDVLQHELLAADILVHPSIHGSDGDAEGGFPVVLTLMAATGGLIVATRHCDIPEICHEGKNGMLVDERDVAGLANAITSMIAAKTRWQEMSSYGRWLVEHEFDAIVQAKRLEGVYDRAIISSKVRPTTKD